MRFLEALKRALPARKPVARPAPPAATARPFRATSPADAYEHLRKIADLDNEATRQIDEAQALLAQTVDECPAIYVEAAISRLKAAREIIEPVVAAQDAAGRTLGHKAS